MATVKVVAHQDFVNVVGFHKLEWRYDIGAWTGLTHSKAINTLAIWGVKEQDADSVLYVAQQFGSWEMQVGAEDYRRDPR